MPKTNFSADPVYYQKGADDPIVVDRVLSGDTAAFALLVERYQKVVYNVALRFLQENDEAEDVAQTVFLKVYERLSTFDRRQKFFSWLYRIAVNESLNHLRQRRPMESMTEQSSTANAQEEVEQADTARLIREAIEMLTPDQKAVIVLRHYEGLAYDEIAAVLSITEQKVRSRLFTARQVLRELLAQRGVQEP